MSSFAINGSIVFDPAVGFSALARAIPAGGDAGVAETRRCPVHEAADPRVHVLELIAAALSIIEVLGRAAAEHHALEEAHLLPAIERRIADTAVLAEFRERRGLLHRFTLRRLPPVRQRIAA